MYISAVFSATKVVLTKKPGPLYSSLFIEGQPAVTQSGDIGHCEFWRRG